jgi:hypothetical protein
MRRFFRERFIRYCCLAVSLAVLLPSASCQKKSSSPASPPPSRPEDHFVGTWKLNQEKTPVFGTHAYNPIPVYEWIMISDKDDARFTLTFSHLSDKPWESNRVLFSDMKTPGFGIDAVGDKLMTYPTYLHRVDADRFTQGSGISENEYTVLPDHKTMKVRQFPLIDNGFQRELVYDKVADSDYVPLPRF